MSENYILRTARISDAAGIARVQVETWRAAYRNLMPDAVLDGLSVERSTLRWQGNLASLPPENYCFVAEVSGEVAGFAAGGPDRDQDADYSGELYAIYVLPQYQGRGLGKALLRAAAGWLVQHGHRRMLLWVLKDNAPARAFYAAQGGQLVRQRTIEIGSANLPEVGYGYELENLTTETLRH